MKFSYTLLMAAILFSAAASLSAVASNVSTSQTIPRAYVDIAYDDDGRDEGGQGVRQGEVRSANNGSIQYISGGVSDDDMRALDSEEGSYNLKMLFVAGGEYLADVNVNIKDAHGHDVLATRDKCRQQSPSKHLLSSRSQS